MTTLTSTGVRAITFSTAKGDSYRMLDVDQFLKRVESTLRGYESNTPVPNPVTVLWTEQVKFEPVKFRKGYSWTEVDAFLDSLVETLREYETRFPQ